MAAVPFSLELFPARTPQTAERLPGILKALAQLGPSYFSVTYGAGGSDQDGTYETLMTVVRETGVEAAPHLTCVGSSRTRIAELLAKYRDAGIRRIVALRGDLPAVATHPAAPGDFHFANELVSFIRQTHGDHFQIEVAAYPEMHPQAPDFDTDFRHFSDKLAAGASGAVTQLFYNVEAYRYFMDRCAKAGIDVPIVPGIMPITGYQNVVRFCGNCGADLPRWIRLQLEQLQHDKSALIDFGTEVVARLCEQLIEAGAPGLHFYTLNQYEPTARICAATGLAPPLRA